MSAIRALVALDEGVDHDIVEASLPIDSDIQIVGLVDGLEESWTTLQETPTDLLVVACAGYSDRALYLIDGAVKQRPERPVVVLATGSPNGFVRRVFEAGADDILTLPQAPPRRRLHVPEGGRPQAGDRRRDRRRPLADDLRARPEGRDRQDADVVQPRGEPRRGGPQGRRRRPRPPVRGRRARARARAQRRRSTTSRSRAGRSTRRSSTPTSRATSRGSGSSWRLRARITPASSRPSSCARSTCTCGDATTT